MYGDSLLLSFLSVFSLITFFVVLITQKIFHKIDSILIDQDFEKPQAFHKEPVARSGGIASIVSLAIFFMMYYFFFNEVLLDYLILSIFLFSLGFLDDIKFNIKPNIRLFLMIGILSFLIFLLSINLDSVDLIFLNVWLSNKLFHTIFILLCFLFIINGANLVDGFNGLLSIHLLFINLILLFVNLDENQNHVTSIIAAQTVILLCFLLFNFPKAKMFLGDSGSYLFGTLTVLNIIKTNNMNLEISSFFFCILLFYLFFEVFFSFFRKIYLKKSPLKPDENHLHMLSFRWLENLQKFKDCNYLNSVIINVVYISLVLPGIFFRDNGIFCRYWFFLLIAFYILFYSRLYSFVKK